MKKLFLGIGLMAGSFMFAQQFGAKAGLNVSSMQGFDGTKAKTGFHAGLFMNAPIAESFSIQPEILYSQYGAKENEGNSNSINLDYITVPVMFQYNATPEFYLEAGPELGLLISSKLKVNNETIDMKDETESFNLGLGLGAGYYFTPNIGLSARYVAGFTDVIKDNVGDAVKNNVFQVGLNYKF